MLHTYYLWRYVILITDSNKQNIFLYVCLSGSLSLSVDNAARIER